MPFCAMRGRDACSPTQHQRLRGIPAGSPAIVCGREPIATASGRTAAGTPLLPLAAARNHHDCPEDERESYRYRCREGSRLRQALGVHGSGGQQPVLVTVPLGQVVLLQMTLVRFAPARVA